MTDDTPHCEVCGDEATEEPLRTRGLRLVCDEALRGEIDKLIERPEAVMELRRSIAVGVAEEWLAAHPGQTPLDAAELLAMMATGVEIDNLAERDDGDMNR